MDGFWWSFVYAVLRLSHEIFLNFSTELWPLIDAKISIFRNNEWILIKKKIYALIYMIHAVIKHIILLNFSTELWPLIDFTNMYMLNILWNNWWIW